MDFYFFFKFGFLPAFLCRQFWRFSCCEWTLTSTVLIKRSSNTNTSHSYCLTQWSRSFRAPLQCSCFRMSISKCVFPGVCGCKGRSKCIHKSPSNKQLLHKVLWWEQRILIQMKLQIKRKKNNSSVCWCVLDGCKVQFWVRGSSESLSLRLCVGWACYHVPPCLSPNVSLPPSIPPFLYTPACLQKHLHQTNALITLSFSLFLVLRWQHLF